MAKSQNNRNIFQEKKEIENALELANREIKEWQKFRDICLKKLKNINNKLE
jgi:hypothetical protein